MTNAASEVVALVFGVCGMRSEDARCRSSTKRMRLVHVTWNSAWLADAAAAATQQRVALFHCESPSPTFTNCFTCCRRILANGSVYQ
jgi:hypothetical protein